MNILKNYGALIDDDEKEDLLENIAKIKENIRENRWKMIQDICD